MDVGGRQLRGAGDVVWSEEAGSDAGCWMRDAGWGEGENLKPGSLRLEKGHELLTTKGTKHTKGKGELRSLRVK
jgi:hypothetical protein